MRSSKNARTHRRARPSAHHAIGIALLLVAVLGFVSNVGLAANSGKTITLGESLNTDEKKELLDFFGAKSNDKVETVTVADTKKAMKGIIDRQFSSAYSSTALTCHPLGDGLDVSTRNITVITPSLYAMALVTAGIGDATLVVAAPNDAPAEGLTALTGVFKTWDIAPCDSGSTSDARQRLALEQLAVAVEIGQSFQAAGIVDGVELAGKIVLETQKTVVIERLKKSADIDKAVAQQEAVQGIAVPADLRPKLIDLMVRLAKQKIDWSTFSAGWEIQYSTDKTGITMKGDGIAIRNAQLTATARAADSLTQTAEAGAALTEEAAANMTATADALATQQAIAGLTATAAARPTQTPVPEPTATPTPAPFAVTGKITGTGGGTIDVAPAGGGAAVRYAVAPDAAISRGAKPTGLTAIKAGDAVSLTIDGSSQAVTQLSATAPAPGLFSKLSKFILIAPVLLIIPLLLFLKGRVSTEPFVVKRVARA